MAQIPCLTGAAGTIVSISQNETKYFPVSHGQFTDSVTNETNAKIDMNAGGTFSNLRVKVATNTLSVASVSFRLRKNGSNGNLVVTVTAGQTGLFEDTSNSDSVTSGDEVNLLFAGNSAGGTGAMTVRTVGVDFAATSNTRQFFVAGSGAGAATTTASATRYIQIGGSLELSVSSEALIKVKMRTGGTFSNLRAYVGANLRTTNSTITFRKNGADGNQTITITALTTGWFEDSSNTDTVTSGDDVNTKHVSGTGTESVTYNTVDVDFETTNGEIMLVNGNTGGGSYTASVTTYTQIGGNFGGSSTESESSMKIYQAGTFSHLSVYVSANTATTDGTYKLRVGNGTQADGNQSVTVTATTTGLFVDTTNTDTISANDYVNTVFTPGNANATLRTMYIKFATASGTVTFTPITCGFF